jgi:hypothetical protein
MSKRSIAPPPILSPLERPHCPKCQVTRMMLARISPGPDGFEIRIFECPKCDHVHQEKVASDPLKSDKARWAEGGLKPPE